MNHFRMIVFICILQITGCGQNDRKDTLEVTYIGNEGFLVAMGSTKVLIDALPRSLYYAEPSDTLAARMINGIPPFDRVDYFLVTHDHADHFNPEMMTSFLLKHPGTQLVASLETCGKLTGDSIAERRRTGVDLAAGQHATIRGENTEITVVRLEHGGWADVNNLAFIVRSNGYTIVHVGDAKLSDNEKYLRAIDWNSTPVDILFAEYFDQSTQTAEIMAKLIHPKHVVLMHIPPGEETSARNVNGKIFPQTVVFGKENETRVFDGTAEVVSVGR